VKNSKPSLKNNKKIKDQTDHRTEGGFQYSILCDFSQKTLIPRKNKYDWRSGMADTDYDTENGSSCIFDQGANDHKSIKKLPNDKKNSQYDCDPMNHVATPFKPDLSICLLPQV